jgi:hypothetical protein
MKHCLKPVCQFVDDFHDVVVVLGAAPGQQEAVCLSGGVADHGDVFAGKRMESVQVRLGWVLLEKSYFTILLQVKESSLF